MGSLLENTEEDWNQIVDTNLKGVWLCLKYEIEAMIEQGAGGSIVNTSAIASVVGRPNFSIYAASKGGVVALTKAVATEYAAQGIRVNVISPGAVKTEILDEMPADVLSQAVAGQPIPRMALPEEIASAVLWLCSDTTSFMTGHNLIIDGGYTAQ